MLGRAIQKGKKIGRSLDHERTTPMQWGNETGPRAHVNISYEYLKQENRKKKTKEKNKGKK